MIHQLRIDVKTLQDSNKKLRLQNQRLEIAQAQARLLASVAMSEKDDEASLASEPKQHTNHDDSTPVDGGELILDREPLDFSFIDDHEEHFDFGLLLDESF